MDTGKSIKETVIKDTAKYNFAQYSSQFLGFFTAIAMRNFLGPYLMGIWSLLRVALEYATFTNLGVEGACAYQIPFLKGKKDKKAEAETTNSGFGFLLLASFLAAVVVLIVAAIFKKRYPPEATVGLVIMSAYIVLQRISSYYITVLRSNSNFSVVNRVVVFDAVVNLALTFFLVKNFRIYGLYVTVVLMAILNTILMQKLAGYRIEFLLKRERILALIKMGFSLLLLGVSTTVLYSIDKIMIAKIMGVTFVGYYSIANMAQSYLYGATNNFSIVAMPRLLEAYGKEENIEHIKKFVTVSAEAVSYLLPYVLGIVFLAVPLFITKVLPKFTPGILAAQILLLDVFFRSCSPQASHFLVALGKQARMIPINAAAVPLGVLLIYAFVKSGLGIAGAALGTTLSSLFVTVVTLAYAMKHFAGPKEISLFILKIIFPLVYVAAVVLSCSRFIALKNPYLQLSVNIMILTVASLPLFFYIDKKTHILRILFSFLKRKNES